MPQSVRRTEDSLNIGYLDSLIERLKALPHEEWKATITAEAQAAIDGVDAVSASILLRNRILIAVTSLGFAIRYGLRRYLPAQVW